MKGEMNIMQLESSKKNQGITQYPPLSLRVTWSGRLNSYVFIFNLHWVPIAAQISLSNLVT